MRILRVDDRFIHGQVVAGWARPLGIKSLIIASDKISKDEWACNAYRLAIPEGIEFSCVGIKQCITIVNKQNKKRPTVAATHICNFAQYLRTIQKIAKEYGCPTQKNPHIKTFSNLEF